jgi:hypothetical protein
VVPQRPATVPEKFWDATKGTVNTEALLASYGELERKQSQPVLDTANVVKDVVTPPVVPPVVPPVTPPVTDPAAIAAAKPDPVKVREAATAELTKAGKLSDATYTALEGAGYDRDTVDAFIAGKKAQGQVMLHGLHAAAGGESQFNSMLQWAAAGNYTPAEAAAFDAAIKSPDEGVRTLAVQGIKARYTAANGTGGNLFKPNADNAGGSTVAFRSRQELVAAMNDPRYAKGDTAYHNEVYAKIKAAKAAGYELGLHTMQSGSF